MTQNWIGYASTFAQAERRELWRLYTTAKEYSRPPSAQLGITDNYAAFCADEVVKMFGISAQNALDRQMSDVDSKGKPKREYADVWREVMHVELSVMEKKHRRAEFFEAQADDDWDEDGVPKKRKIPANRPRLTSG